VLGGLFVLFALPPAALVVALTVVWNAIDPITPRVRKAVVWAMHPIARLIVKKPEDSFIVGVVILQAVVQPIAFFCLLAHTVKSNSFSILYAYLYHVIRIGPHFTNYAYAYTLCHKEGHVKRVGFWREPFSYFLHSVFNWWIGLFYGVMPSSFSYGHSRNHHRHNNDKEDVVSTWDRPRDSFWNYLAYVPRWNSYHMNISSTFKFLEEKEPDVAAKLVMGTVYWLVFFCAISMLHFRFALAYLLYPVVESMLLLSAINWAWHCFLDPDKTNIYASSVTLFHGKEETNILNEDYHVVHHQYPSAHWLLYPNLYEKHREEYIANKATILDDTNAMEIFFLAILQKYEIFAEKWVDLSGTMSYEEKKELVITRLRHCSWGSPFAQKAGTCLYEVATAPDDERASSVNSENGDTDAVIVSAASEKS